MDAVVDKTSGGAQPRRMDALALAAALPLQQEAAPPPSRHGCKYAMGYQTEYVTLQEGIVKERMHRVTVARVPVSELYLYAEKLRCSDSTIAATVQDCHGNALSVKSTGHINHPCNMGGDALSVRSSGHADHPHAACVAQGTDMAWDPPVHLPDTPTMSVDSLQQQRTPPGEFVHPYFLTGTPHPKPGPPYWHRNDTDPECPPFHKPEGRELRPIQNWKSLTRVILQLERAQRRWRRPWPSEWYKVGVWQWVIRAAVWGAGPVDATCWARARRRAATVQLRWRLQNWRYLTQRLLLEPPHARHPPSRNQGDEPSPCESPLISSEAVLATQCPSARRAHRDSVLKNDDLWIGAQSGPGESVTTTRGSDMPAEAWLRGGADTLRWTLICWERMCRVIVMRSKRPYFRFLRNWKARQLARVVWAIQARYVASTSPVPRE